MSDTSHLSGHSSKAAKQLVGARQRDGRKRIDLLVNHNFSARLMHPAYSGRWRRACPRPAAHACFCSTRRLGSGHGRSWTGWHRHITLAMLAHAYLAVIRRTAGGEKGALDLEADLLPFIVPEVRRLLWHLVWARPPDREAARA